MVSWIFSALAVLALALVAVGLYSVVSYTVAQRNNEFGSQMASGAQRGHLPRIVFSATAISVSSGRVPGLALSFVLYRILAHWIENNSSNAITLLAGTLLLAAASASACLFPALRAPYIDPIAALRID